MTTFKIKLYKNNLEISGSVTFDNVIQLLDMCIKRTNTHSFINLDCKNLDSINSSVLIFIINYIRNAIKNKQKVKIINASDLLLELIKVYNLDNIIYNY